ncbi:Mrp/NBP35 family ATP-binding protein [Helcococcus kunzii]|uniref:Mrp/NBP35 family ATP-binding protein n=1 Tax=Helcococcus kunzii TaxID=40091 RepID=UPI001BAE98E0|nr:Mrp/NBP35 family ATP-binding protein [Helcococcus kunzii]QUY64230.1 Mrp/NBP35 family ATP-binding protein [Helcococcus kunzii]QZO76686.1 Mrp/NBP35 family ATP-binding protein [Helcococcus kunzii]
MRNLDNREKRAIFRLEQNKNSNVKNVIAIVSGKGGVGKSLVTSLLASEMNKEGKTTAILDADITGPSIPKAFGLKDKLKFTEKGTVPALSKNGIKIVSTNLLIDDEASSVVWRAPILTAAIRQFWQDIAWGEVDYMFVDLPPGTSDPQLTVFQSIPLMGMIVVTSPQESVSIIVEKAMNMAKKLNVPVIGVVENFSYFIAPDTGTRYNIFGESKTKKLLIDNDVELIGEIPIDPDIPKHVDEGKIEDLKKSYMKNTIERIYEFEQTEQR